MNSIMFKFSLLLLCVSFGGRDVAGAVNAPISCADAPKDAMLKIPSEPVAKWAQVVCTPFGHVIMPAPSYVWSLYGGLAPVVFPSQKPGKGAELSPVGHKSYFKSLVVDVLGDAERDHITKAAALDDRLPAKRPIVYRLRATSNKGGETLIYFLQFPERLEGATPCVSEKDCKNIGELQPFFITSPKKSG